MGFIIARARLGETVIFISHLHADEEFVNALQEQLDDALAGGVSSSTLGKTGNPGRRQLSVRKLAPARRRRRRERLCRSRQMHLRKSKGPRSRTTSHALSTWGRVKSEDLRELHRRTR